MLNPFTFVVDFFKLIVAVLGPTAVTVTAIALGFLVILAIVRIVL